MMNIIGASRAFFFARRKPIGADIYRRAITGPFKILQCGIYNLDGGPLSGRNPFLVSVMKKLGEPSRGPTPVESTLFLSSSPFYSLCVPLHPPPRRSFWSPGNLPHISLYICIYIYLHQLEYFHFAHSAARGLLFARIYVSDRNISR